MGILSNIRHQRDQRQVGKASGLDGFGGSPAALSEDGIGGVVLGDLPVGLCSREPARRKERVSVLSHAPDFAPGESGSVNAKASKVRKLASTLHGLEEEGRRKLEAAFDRFFRRLYRRKRRENVAADLGVSRAHADNILKGKPFGLIARVFQKYGVDLLTELAREFGGEARLRLRFRRRQTQGA